jgi:hypothetical protein
MLGVGCDLVLLKALMRPDLVVEASGTQDVVGAQWSPTESNMLDGGRRKACTRSGAGSVGRVGGPFYGACRGERGGVGGMGGGTAWEGVRGGARRGWE